MYLRESLLRGIVSLSHVFDTFLIIDSTCPPASKLASVLRLLPYNIFLYELGI